MHPRALDVDGTPIRWLEMGTGFPVVLIHGIPTSPLLWRHVAPLVAGRCPAFEMVGYGSSIPAGESRDISVAAQAGHLLRWLDALDDRAILAGHDLGDVLRQAPPVYLAGRLAALVPGVSPLARGVAGSMATMVPMVAGVAAVLRRRRRTGR